MKEKNCGKGNSVMGRLKPNKVWVSRALCVLLAFVLIYTPIAPAANAAEIEVTNFTMSVDTVGAGDIFVLRLDYKDTSGYGINDGDTISVMIDNSANDIIKVVCLDGSTANIYGDDPGNPGIPAVVGTRTYTNGSDGNYHLDIVFNDGYESIYGVTMGSAGISGFYEASARVEYRNEVTSEVSTEIKAVVNGFTYTFPVTVKVGGGSGPAPEVNTPGPLVGKYARYGKTTGNLYDLPFVESPSQVDYTKFDTMRWGLSIGYQNLTWRDLRATGGAAYFTTLESLAYSNNNPTAADYASASESYLVPYQEIPAYLIESPYLYKDAVVDDYLIVGEGDNRIFSAHEYLADSVRIIRILGRKENNSDKYEYKQLADSNFLVADANESVDRLMTSTWEGYRGLTLNEFLARMQSEGQFIGKTVSDLFTVDYVDYTQSPFYYFYTVPTGTKIAHLQLNLGDMHFGDTTDRVNLVGTDNTTVFSSVAAKYLPYGYYIYYDTKAAEANLSTNSLGAISINYNNEATFTYNNVKKVGGNNAVWVRVENSGGSGGYTTLKIKKVDASGDPASGIKFTLTQTNTSPNVSREVDTGINGTASFTLGLGDYTLTETVPSGSNLEPVAPISFSITSLGSSSVDLTGLLPAGYVDASYITFDVDTNIIVNQAKPEVPTVRVPLTGHKIVLDADDAPLAVIPGQFTFTLTPAAGNPAGWSWNQSNPVAVAAGGALDLGTLTFTLAGTYEFTVSETIPTTVEEGWEYDSKDVTVTVEVTDTAGVLSADATYTKDSTVDPDGEAKFINSYEAPEEEPGNDPGGEPGTEPEPKTGTGQIKVSKSISGVNSTALTFTFNTEQVADENGAALAGGGTPIVVAPVTTSGEITRATGAVIPIALGELAEGTYYFKVTEDRSAVPANWTFSGAVYIVKVEVDEDGVTTVTYPDNYSDNNPPAFANSYRSGGGSSGGGSPTVTEVNEGDDDDADGDVDRGEQEEVITDTETPEESVEELGLTTEEEQTGTSRLAPEFSGPSSQPQTRTPGANLTADGVDFLEIGDDGVALGRWVYDEDQGVWIFEEYTPLGNMPKTGGAETTTNLLLLLGCALIGLGVIGKVKTRKHNA